MNGFDPLESSRWTAATALSFCKDYGLLSSIGISPKVSCAATSPFYWISMTFPARPALLSDLPLHLVDPESLPVSLLLDVLQRLFSSSEQ